MVSVIATTGWHVAPFYGLCANQRLPNKCSIANLDTLYTRKNFIGLDWMSFEKLENLWHFERIPTAPNQLQLVLGGRKRTHVQCSWRQTRDCGHWDHTTWLDWFGTSEIWAWNGPLYDVKISRHLNVHWGQQIAFVWPYSNNLWPTACDRTFSWGLGHENAKYEIKKLFFKSETIRFDQKWYPLLLPLGDM